MTSKKIVVHLDPAVGSTNLGDEIISEAIAANLRTIFPDYRMIRMSSRDIGRWSCDVLASADLVVFGGSNALSSNPVMGYRQFAMGFLQYLGLRNVLLLGVGWWQYQNGLGLFSRALYKRMLNPDMMHSVRDDYTLFKMREMGFANVLNTACPTMWNLTGFEAIVSGSVILTLTDYNRKPQRDLALLKEGIEKFDHVYFWPQGTHDEQYLETFSQAVDLGRINMLKPSLAALDACLAERPCYVGTRLHAGIRALQHQCPTYIVPIDNRATEIAKTERLALYLPEVGGVEPGVMYRFSHDRRQEVAEFIEQFGRDR